MGHTRKDRSKKWLISRLKTSGSKRDYIANENYRDYRNSKKTRNLEDLPKQESYSKTFKFYNNKINYGLLVRFLRRNVGRDWESVHNEILERIPTKLSEYRDCIYWFVADQVELKDKHLWCRREQKFLVFEQRTEQKYSKSWDTEIYKEFYVDPETNTLKQIVLESTRATKNLTETELRKFREQEKKDRQVQKAHIKKINQEQMDKATKILRTHKSNGSL